MSLPDPLATARLDYTRGGLTESDLAADPVTMFRRWYDDAVAAGVHEPNAMVISTATPQGRPSARFVLLKGVDSGFVFFTNLASRKGEELIANSACAVLFPWHPLERQVRIDGRAELVSRAEVAAYFATRPRGSQIGAWASPQSAVVAGREELDERYTAAAAQFGDGEVPVPDRWGGFRVVPETVEFWQGRPGRMHDRLVYVRDGEGWRTERLAP